ncbi:3'-5' exonuclease [Endozoicomonas sp. ONNA1]|uniref:3'-5' exonuclease n=1 Tax=Endozoicomonas sp. ONNA1 TaxID=2828740 RepID=UPI0021475AC2|nr:3'-5' exonuclease [Endozoicomonas sp. ONNA1]
MTILIEAHCDGLDCDAVIQLDELDDIELLFAGWQFHPDNADTHYCPDCWKLIQQQYSETDEQQKKTETDSKPIEPHHDPYKYATLAQQWLDDDPLFLDTETTGLDEKAEVVEISIIDSNGEVLLDTLIKPTLIIPDDATAIHGITNKMVEDAPSWPEIHEKFCQIVQNRTLLIYNADYDVAILDQTACAWIRSDKNIKIDLPESLYSARCIMKLYAAFFGQWDNYRDDWKWQKLTVAADQMGVIVEGQAHRALADCKMTLGVLQAMTSILPAKAETLRSKS